MEKEAIVFELSRGDQFFKNPVMVKKSNGGYKNIGYVKGVNTIDVDKHPSGVKYESVYFPYSRAFVEDPLMVEFLKAQDSFSKEPNAGRIWIHDSEEKAKRENELRSQYIEAMNYINSLTLEEINIKAFAKIGVAVLKLSQEELKAELYNIADENPAEIIELKDDSTFDFIGKAIYSRAIELKDGGFYLYGERQNLLFQTPYGMNSKERFADFLKSKDGKDVYELIVSKMPEDKPRRVVPKNGSLQDIKGVGVTLEAMLKESGINNISELAKLTEDELTMKLINSGGSVPKMVKLNEIIDRAKELVKEMTND